MDFAFNSEQTQLADALRRWLDKEYSFEKRRQIIHSESGVSAAAWQGLADLGIFALPIAEEFGGFGGGAADLLPVMQEIGRGLLVEPLQATLLAARLLQTAGGEYAQQLLPRVALGEIKLACALHESQARHDVFDLACVANQNADGWLLQGEKAVVLHGAQADYLLLAARSSGARRDLHGISLFLLPQGTAGVECRDYRTIDGQRAAHLRLNQVQLPAQALLGQLDAGWPLLEAALDYSLCLLCAEAVGAMQALHAATLEYVKTRQQFGAPIGKFQVLQHRLAEMYMQIEQAQSMAMLAALHTDSQAAGRARIVSAAKARIGQAAKFVGQQAVQLHGGIGVTDELQAAHYFKRLTMLELSLGDTDHHLARFIAQPEFATSRG